MGLIWDPLLVEYLARELAERFAGRTLRAVHLDAVTRTALLFLDDEALAFELHPLRGGIHLFPGLTPPADAMPLGLRILTVRAPADERILFLELGRGRTPRPRARLAVELMANQWNAILADARSGTIRAVLWPRVAGSRRLIPGHPYEPPRPSTREGIRSPISLKRWMALLGSLTPAEREAALVRTVAYTSRVNARALLGDVGAADGPAGEAALEEGWRRWLDLHRRPRPRPCLLHLDDRLQPYPFPLPDIVAQAVDSLVHAVARARAEAGGSAPTALPAPILLAIESRLDAARRASKRLTQQLAAVPNPDDLRTRAHLLLARLASVPRGLREVTLPGFDDEPVQLTLDPSLPPAENALRLYREAGRAERARVRLPALISRAHDRVERLERLLADARTGRPDPERLRATLQERAPEMRRAGAAQRPPVPYRRYRTSGGLEVRVGRGARANDALTFRHSRPDDVWLHARHAAGAHVVLRWDRPENPPARDLAEAAGLAALHSRARTSSAVPVDWTRRKHVRKPRGAAPGVVVPSYVRTIFVEPDPALERRLAWTGEPEEGAG
ncbi:MAG: DUF814 domain-containing protein [Gemmatimonadetes bacterium]|nr:DUF814 domain-containing protein [Gemmatimonadota bacterium]